MKGTDHFKELIQNYLDNRAKEDELFRAKYETTTRTIDDVVNYIFHAVQQSSCCGFSDMEVYAMAVHAIDEPDLEIGKPMDCNVVVNHHIELTEEASPSNDTRRRKCGNCSSATADPRQPNRNPNPFKNSHSFKAWNYESKNENRKTGGSFQ